MWFSNKMFLDRFLGKLPKCTWHAHIYINLHNRKHLISIHSFEILACRQTMTGEIISLFQLLVNRKSQSKSKEGPHLITLVSFKGHILC